jgi:hypothetical protein
MRDFGKEREEIYESKSLKLVDILKEIKKWLGCLTYWKVF